jgi:hypothetical protein
LTNRVVFLDLGLGADGKLRDAIFDASADVDSLGNTPRPLSSPTSSGGWEEFWRLFLDSLLGDWTDLSVSVSGLNVPLGDAASGSAIGWELFAPAIQAEHPVEQMLCTSATNWIGEAALLAVGAGAVVDPRKQRPSSLQPRVLESGGR